MVDSGDRSLSPEYQQWSQLGIPFCCAVWGGWRVCKPLLNHSSLSQKSSESLDYEDLECLKLGPSEAKGEAPPEEQPSPSRPSTSRPGLQSGAAAVLKHVWFRRTKNCQKEESLDKTRTKPSSGKKIGSQRAFPRFHSSIRLAMQEIQQVSWGISSAKPCHPQPLCDT